VSESHAGIEDEVREALRELLEQTGALSARIVENDDLRTGVPARTLALGGGEYLRVELPSRSTSAPGDVEAAFDRISRQLRAIRRRWEVSRLPEITVTPGVGVVPTKDRVTERIEAYMKGLASIDHASNAFVTKGTQLIACATPAGEQDSSRWQFLARRALSTHAPGSSHGEIVDPDAFAMSFFYDCALVVLLAEPYAIDFVRHRCRQVARELANLLPLLDPEPETPAMIRRRPPTLP
jgi:hypothetical protein